MLKRDLYVVFIIVLLFISPPVHSQTNLQKKVEALEKRVDSLEKRLEKLEGKEGSTAPTVFSSEHVRYGTPSAGSTILDKHYFIISHRNDWKIPEWVIYSITEEDLSGDVDRTNDFKPDPQLPPGERAELTDYRNSGFDRGHMAPAGDFKRNKEAMSTTFLLSNMAPQTALLNRGMWENLESQARSKVRQAGKAWIVTGNTFLDSHWQRVSPQNHIGANAVAVPTHCYKVILTEKLGGLHSLYAFLMPNINEDLTGPTVNYIITVDNLEQLTGLDFFPGLPDPEEDSLETLILNDWTQ